MCSRAPMKKAKLEKLARPRGLRKRASEDVMAARAREDMSHGDGASLFKAGRAWRRLLGDLPNGGALFVFFLSSL